MRATATVVEVWHGGVRVTSHERSSGPKGTAVTKPEHRPRAHREWGDWPPERLLGWAQSKGPKTAEVAGAILGRGPHPESGRRACLGLFRLGERYGSARLEAACARALAVHNPTYKSVEAILKTSLDKVALTEEAAANTVVHDNIRGGDYFDCHEVEATSSHDEIEARYLEEERLSIMNEHQVEGRWEAPSPGAASTPAPALETVVSPPAFKTLPALLERLQALWARPRGATDRGGDDSPSRYEESSSCTSQSVCVAIPHDTRPSHGSDGPRASHGAARPRARAGVAARAPRHRGRHDEAVEAELRPAHRKQGPRCTAPRSARAVVAHCHREPVVSRG